MYVDCTQAYNNYYRGPVMCHADNQNARAHFLLRQLHANLEGEKKEDNGCNMEKALKEL